MYIYNPCTDMSAHRAGTPRIQCADVHGARRFGQRGMVGLLGSRARLGSRGVWRMISGNSKLAMRPGRRCSHCPIQTTTTFRGDLAWGKTANRIRNAFPATKTWGLGFAALRFQTPSPQNMDQVVTERLLLPSMEKPGC